MDRNSKIIIFGASGLVGSAIIRKLLEKDYKKIIGIYKSKKPTFKNIKLFQVDLTNQTEIEKFFEHHKPEYVFLAAAKVGGILANNTYKADFIYENMAIALNVINSAYKYGVKKLLNLGSSCIYPKHAPQPMKEEYLLTGALEPTNEPYAIAKISAIKLCRYYNEQYGTNFISVMPTNLYGPNDNFDLFTSHVLPALIRKFHLGKALMEGDWEAVRKDLNKLPIEGIDGSAEEEKIIKVLKKYGITPEYLEVWGSGEVYREFLHVDDLADACVFLMENVDAEEMKKYCADYFVNVGTGEDLTIKELALMIKDIIRYRGDIKHDLSKPDGTPRKLLDVSKIKDMGWVAKIPLREGIREVYQNYLW
ncbi:MAG: GDP-L-fucose synthase, partial [Thermodesulfovibrio sp.]|nr:GDP-L-fucose synthase [Thermodesulfovibrio sp.]